VISIHRENSAVMWAAVAAERKLKKTKLNESLLEERL